MSHTEIKELSDKVRLNNGPLPSPAAVEFISQQINNEFGERLRKAEQTSAVTKTPGTRRSIIIACAAGGLTLATMAVSFYLGVKGNGLGCVITGVSSLIPLRVFSLATHND